MKNRILIIGAMVACVLLSAAVLQNVARAADPATPLKADTDTDETLDLAEVKIAAGAHFDKINTDGDTTLETGEVEGLLGPKMFKAADTDNDGTISKDEYLALVETVFKKTDADNDGTLTVKELKSRSGRELKKLID